MNMLSAMEYRDWLMVAGAVLLVVGFICHRERWRSEEEKPAMFRAKDSNW